MLIFSNRETRFHNEAELFWTTTYLNWMSTAQQQTSEVVRSSRWKWDASVEKPTRHSFFTCKLSQLYNKPITLPVYISLPNRYELMETLPQNSPSVHICCGIVEDQLIVLSVLEAHLTSNRHLCFMEDELLTSLNIVDIKQGL